MCTGGSHGLQGVGGALPSHGGRFAAQEDYDADWLLPDAAVLPDLTLLADATRCLGVLESQPANPWWSPTVKIILSCFRHMQDPPSSHSEF